MGLDLGLEKHEFKTVVAVENNIHAQATIKLNRPSVLVLDDAFSDQIEHLKESQAPFDAIVGGPPCQSWSYAGKRMGMDDQRGLAIPRFLDIVEAFRPKFVVMENVLGLTTASIDGNKGAVIQLIFDRLKQLGYAGTINQVNAADFGCPQTRKRVVVLAKLHSAPPSLRQTHISPKHDSMFPKWLTLKDVIGDRPNGDGLLYTETKAQFFRLLKAGQDWRNLPDELKDKAMKGAMQSGGGRTGFFRRLS
jgi:DNA (cytosine-5)-methyltransferase 1